MELQCFEQYFIIEKGKLKNIKKKDALTQEVFGLKKNPRGHVYMNHMNCLDQDCPICNKGMCLICGGVDDSLTTDCIGVPLDEDTLKRVSRGEIDYIENKWVKIEKISTSVV